MKDIHSSVFGGFLFYWWHGHDRCGSGSFYECTGWRECDPEAADSVYAEAETSGWFGEKKTKWKWPEKRRLILRWAAGNHESGKEAWYKIYENQEEGSNMEKFISYGKLSKKSAKKKSSIKLKKNVNDQNKKSA